MIENDKEGDLPAGGQVRGILPDHLDGEDLRCYGGGSCCNGSYQLCSDEPRLHPERWVKLPSATSGE